MKGVLCLALNPDPDHELHNLYTRASVRGTETPASGSTAKPGTATYPGYRTVRYASGSRSGSAGSLSRYGSSPGTSGASTSGRNIGLFIRITRTSIRISLTNIRIFGSLTKVWITSETAESRLRSSEGTGTDGFGTGSAAYGYGTGRGNGLAIWRIWVWIFLFV